MEQEISKTIASPLEKVKASLFKNNITKDVQTAALSLQKVTVIENDLQRIELDGYIKNAKAIRKQVETLRMNETKQLDDAKKLFMQAEKDFAANLDELIASATGKVNKFIQDQITAKRAEEKRIQEEAEKAAKRLRAPESLARVEMQAQAQIQELPTIAGVRKVWKFEGLDIAKIPLAFLTIDEAAVKEAIKAGVREIPGIRIYEDFARSGR
jgi:hypothetical protein